MPLPPALYSQGTLERHATIIHSQFKTSRNTLQYCSTTVVLYSTVPGTITRYTRHQTQHTACTVIEHTKFSLPESQSQSPRVPEPRHAHATTLRRDAAAEPRPQPDDYASGMRKKTRTHHAVLVSEKRIGQNTYLLSIILGL